MLRFAFSSLLLVTVLSAPAAFAQQNSKKTSKPAAKAEPVMAAPAPVATPAPANDGFAAPAVGAAVDASPPQSEGFSIAPGFTAAPSRRVSTDYRGRPLTPYVRRSVREVAPVAAPMPAPAPEPVAVEPTPAPATATASATKKSSGAATATKPAAAPAAKKAPAKKKADDGWGSGGSGW
jgi:Zn-dependent protease with chaperone function